MVIKMQIDIKDVTEGRYDGKEVYICDYRLGDGGILKKPIRNLPPQKVLVRSNDELPKNKTIYYSNSHFVKLKSNGLPSSAVIPVFDNTGYRMYSGVPVKIFDNMDECVVEFQKMVDEVIDKWEKYKQQVIPMIDDNLEELYKLKNVKY